MVSPVSPGHASLELFHAFILPPGKYCIPQISNWIHTSMATHWKGDPLSTPISRILYNSISYSYHIKYHLCQNYLLYQLSLLGIRLLGFNVLKWSISHIDISCFSRLVHVPVFTCMAHIIWPHEPENSTQLGLLHTITCYIWWPL